MSGFGRKLRAARQRKGMTQEELARRSGISINTVVKLESGAVRQPLAGTAHRLAAALGVPLEELLGEAELPTDSGHTARGAG